MDAHRAELARLGKPLDRRIGSLPRLTSRNSPM
jgi:hypothetical protein